ncbi:MAG: binding-protein-dependent transport system inner rane component [Microvirga sp.]|jgi:putative spermidine/putrescine transport system permease protein|nr:binding-protein-dependent transport system inner rane component [Microvirga sp.]
MSDPAADQAVAPSLLTRTGGLVAWTGYLFLLLPSLIVIPVSFSGSQEFQFPPREFSLSLYREFFSEQAWWGATIQSFKVAVMTTVLATVIAVPAAYGLVRAEFPGKRALNVLVLSPILVPVIVLGLGLYLNFAWLGIVGSTASLVVAHTVLVVPFIIVAVSSGLRQIDPALETVALLMGAGRARVMRSVVLPQIRPAIAVGALFAFLISFDEVVVAYFLAGPTTMTLPVKMYSAIRWEISPVLAAISTLLTLASLLVCVAMLLLQKPEQKR